MSDALQKPVVPKLRFPEFKGDWKHGIIRQYLQKLAEPVDVEPDEEYRQIGVRSHGKGLFHKEAVFGSELGEKRVFWVQPNALVINIVFAWEQALALTTEDEKGMIASHRFPMFAPVKGKADLDFAFHFFMRKQGKALLALASPGGAGRNKTLGQSEFMKLKVTVSGADPRAVSCRRLEPGRRVAGSLALRARRDDSRDIRRTRRRACGRFSSARA